jgi:transposase-like protein
MTYEAIRQWCRTCGQSSAHQLQRRCPQPGDPWHLDEVFRTTYGEWRDLSRAVDHNGTGLDILVPSLRHTKAANTCFHQLLQGFRDVPRVIITDQPNSDGAAKRKM